MTRPVQLPEGAGGFDAGESPVGIVAGSGLELTSLLDETMDVVPFDAVHRLHKGSVAGHTCDFVCGRHRRVPIVLQCGRLHAYEGLSFADVVRTVDVLYAFGVRRVLFTNAVGGVAPELRPGNLVAAHAVACWPYAALELPETLAPDFVIKGCDSVGVFQWMHGPSYETPAEISALRHLNRATVGMSTAPEILRCAVLGIRSALVSCVTNVFGGRDRLTHQNVLLAAAHTSSRLRDLIAAFLSDFEQTEYRQ